MVRKIITVLKNLLSVVVGLAVALLLAEGVLHLLEMQSGGGEKHLMWSSPHFVRAANGAVSFRPNEDVRMVSTDGNGIEVDVRYHINNMGLIDSDDYHSLGSGVRRIAFVGDSLTAGQHGGSPWVPALRNKLAAGRPTYIYNLGVSGASVPHFAKLLENFSKSIALDEVVIVVISDDFMRYLWHPYTTDKEVFFCKHESDPDKCTAPKPVGTIIDFDADDSEILAHVAELDAATEAPSSGSRLLALVGKAYDGYRHGPQDRLEKWLRILIGKNIAAIAAIREQFPDKKIRLLHLPVTSEVVAGRYQHEADIAEPLKQRLAELDIDYLPALYKCNGWSADMFFAGNGHPNASGYDAISRCAEKLLQLDEPRAAESPGASVVAAP